MSGLRLQRVPHQFQAAQCALQLHVESTEAGAKLELDLSLHP